MSDPVISVNNLSKRYRLGQITAATFQESVQSFLRRIVARARGASSDERDCRQEEDATQLWALRDVSFSVSQGEVVGIIGRNGAGKSTLLKLLTRITAPTSGRAVLRGRVASLLEVGTGFHPDLTGRENIFLNGAILGMGKREISGKFDEIVAFAGIEKFVDTPVKRYSSGMYVRLAFGVAAHLDPEILLIDEVLAVGDAAFQAKCIGKMGEIGKEGRTILIVSHNMASISNLCQRAILLDGGQVQFDGPARQAVERYLFSSESAGTTAKWVPEPGEFDSPIGCLLSIEIAQNDIRCEGGDVDIAKALDIQITYQCRMDGAILIVSLHLSTAGGVDVLATDNRPETNLVDDMWGARPHAPGSYDATCTIPACFLNDDGYRLTAILGIVEDGVCRRVQYVEDAISFLVHDTGEMRSDYYGNWIGVIRPKLAWKTDQLPAGS